MAAEGSKFAVISALAGNSVVMVAKFVGFAVTGSGAMFSEAMHTAADLLNQILLLVGIVRSGRSADEMFEYGYAAERYVWALMSAVGIFFLGCGVTLYHGISSLLDPHPLKELSWAVGVLLFSFAIELLILVLAVRAVAKNAHGKPLLRYLREDADPSGVAVILEDFAACSGVVIALIAIVLTQLTGDYYWDAIGSILVGLLLGAVALWLIDRNKDLLVGKGIPDETREQLLEIVRQHPAVLGIRDVRTRVMDTQTFRVKADIQFDGRVLAKQLQVKMQTSFPDLSNHDKFEGFCAHYAHELVELMGEEVNRIEDEIRAAIPQARHIDFEAD